MRIWLPKPGDDGSEVEESGAGGASPIVDGTHAAALVSDNSSQNYDFDLVAAGGVFAGSIPNASGNPGDPAYTLTASYVAGDGLWHAQFNDTLATYTFTTPGVAAAFPAAAFALQWVSSGPPDYSMFS